jgi:protein-disulfide isomerase
MKCSLALPALAALLIAFALPARAADTTTVPERIYGKPTAPVTVEEFVSLTCPHCADFYVNILPKLKEKYVDSGKVRFILRDFPLDGPGLRAASLARCMPEDEFYPFVEVLFKEQKSWALAADPNKVLVQYARLGGLPEDKAEACLADTQMQDAIIALRTAAQQKYEIQATPTFVFNNGAQKLEGAESADKFSEIIDKLLAGTK